MSNKKKIVIVLIFIAIIVAVVAVVMAFREVNQKNTLVAEINSLSEDNINEEIVSTGQYGIIEQLIKNDYKIYSQTRAEFIENKDIVSELKLLNIENYSNDGPEFTSSLETLNELKTKNEELIATLEDLVDDTSIEARATDAGLSGKYKAMYIDILDQIQMAESVADAKDVSEQIATYLDSLIELLTYMKDNSSLWFIENDTLKSQSDTFIEEYNTKVESISL